ncbi:MAG: class I SAM-dependent methyltransferase [Ignavibacteriaceae bacterium]
MNSGLIFNVIFFGAIICLAIIFYRLSVKNVWFNHKRLSVIGKFFYNYYYSIEKINHLRTNNFGYAPVDHEVSGYEPDLQYGIQLYKETVTNHNGYLINENCIIVEIGCGKGAGSEFLIKKFKPKKYIGVDYSKVAIDFCKNLYSAFENAEFICGDAHMLPLTTASADVVVNIESSHIYKDLTQFLSEVNRVLKAHGKFLFTDYRYIKYFSIDSIEREIDNAGFSIIEKKIITPQIYKACILASERRAEIVEEASPWYLKKFFYHYAILKGTKKFIKLGNGEIIYFLYHLAKKGNEKIELLENR